MRKIVNFANRGRENYLVGQPRLRFSLKTHAPDDELLFYTNGYPPNSPTHAEIPYAFKWFAMKEAIQQGADKILWLDASVVVHKSIEPLWDIVNKRGVLVFDNPGCPEYFYTSEDCLNKLGCPMAEAEKITQVCGGIVGINMKSDIGQETFLQMYEWAKDPVLFSGGSNTSSHPKFIAHRHDQSCLSYLVHRDKIKREPFIALRYTNDILPETILELRGM